jgi:hypothetical protein
MGLMQMTAFVMLPRGMLKQQKLLTDQKDDLASNTVSFWARRKFAPVCRLVDTFFDQHHACAPV